MPAPTIGLRVGLACPPELNGRLAPLGHVNHWRQRKQPHCSAPDPRTEWVCGAQQDPAGDASVDVVR